ncbi:MAG: FG-GAP-like repeat-containing protein [Polyangiales bacterium]
MKLRRRAILAPSLLLLLLAASTNDARASWPPPAGATTEQLMNPENWPNDNDYGPRNKDGKPDPNGSGGEWVKWSWVPKRTIANYRKSETAAGMSADVAWTYTIGDPRVKIAILDSGIKWDEPDLVHKVAINQKELVNAKPLDAAGKPCGGDGELAGFDCNTDGVFDLYDYEVSKKVQTPTGVVDLRDANANKMLDPGDLIVMFSDGKDDDNNGFVDDIAGWDFMKDDNDPYDDTRYGHGTGEAHDSSGEANNGISGQGFCPKCRFIPLRVGDSFIVDVQDYAQAVTYGVDNGVKIIQEALGSVNQTNLSRAAMDLAWSRGVVIIASAADENSRHHNMPGNANHTLIVHAIQKDRDDPAQSTTYLAYHPCSNFGGNVPLSASGSGCASEATGNTSGIAGLIYSEALATKLTPDLHAGEVEQLLKMSADLIDIPESYDPKNPDYNPTLYYPSKPTFSQRFGYGRINAGAAVKMVADGKIPPVVDITSPQMFEILYPQRATTDVEIHGVISAKRAKSYSAKIQWAAGVDPDEDKWQPVSEIPMQGPEKVYGEDGTPLAFFKVKDLKIDNLVGKDKTGPNRGEVENRYTVTIRIQVTADYGGTIGTVKGEARRPLYIYDDPTILPGFPKFLGTSGEASPRLVDIDGDGKRDILYPTGEGVIHAYKADGSEIPGWPFKTRNMDGLQPDKVEGSPFVQNYLGGENSWTKGDMKLDLAHESIMSAPAIGDVDGDGKDDIVFGTWAGTIYAIDRNAKLLPGFPIRLPDVPSCPLGDAKKLPDGTPCMDLENHIARGTFPAVTLVDMNKDGKLELVIAAFDGKVYVKDGTGKDLDGFPVTVYYDGPLAKEKHHARIVTTPAVGDLNGDGIPEIAVGSNQYVGNGGNLGVFYVIDGRGNAAPGGPYLPGWPVNSSSFKLFPLVGEGVVSAGMMADVDGDGKLEVVFHGTGGTPYVLPANPGKQAIPGGAVPNAVLTLDPNFGENYESPEQLPGNNFIPVFSQPSFGDLDQDGKPDIIALGASFTLALSLQGSGERQEYEQQMAMWGSGNLRDCSDGSGNKCAFMFPGSPTITEDYTFFHNATVADLSGDDYPEVIVGTGGYYVRAVDACGREAPGFPKFTGGWVIPSVAVGDLDGDGKMEAVTGTRDGWVYAWHTEGREDGVIEWPTHHHDIRNTGNYQTAIDFPKRKHAAKALDLATCKKIDPNAPANEGTPSAEGGGGCGCSVPDTSSSQSAAGLSALAALLAIAARRRK